MRVESLRLQRTLATASTQPHGHGDEKTATVVQPQQQHALSQPAPTSPHVQTTHAQAHTRPHASAPVAAAYAPVSAEMASLASPTPMVTVSLADNGTPSPLPSLPGVIPTDIISVTSSPDQPHRLRAGLGPVRHQLAPLNRPGLGVSAGVALSVHGQQDHRSIASDVSHWMVIPDSSAGSVAYDISVSRGTAPPASADFMVPADAAALPG